jgi:hypothetical protein
VYFCFKALFFDIYIDSNANLRHHEQHAGWATFGGGKPPARAKARFWPKSGNQFVLLLQLMKLTTSALTIQTRASTVSHLFLSSLVATRVKMY